jgi:hypothetical protein
LIIDGKHKLDKQNLSFYGGGYWFYERSDVLGLGRPGVGHPQLGLNAWQIGDGAAWQQNLDVNLFRRFPSTPNEFGPETNSIGRSIQFWFHPYNERPKRTPYATGVSISACATPEL